MRSQIGRIRLWGGTFCLLCAFCSPAKEGPRELEPLIAQLKAGTASESELQRFGLQCRGVPFSVERLETTLSPQAHLTILQVWSSSCDRRTLLLFRKTSRGWSIVQTIYLRAFYGEQPIVTFPELFKPGEHEILVRGEIVDKGTGMVQRNIGIYKWIRGRVELVFDDPEMIHFEVPTETALFQLDQKSTFTFSHPGTPGVSVDEVQVITEGTVSLTRFRGCTWSDEASRFRCYEVAPPPK